MSPLIIVIHKQALNICVNYNSLWFTVWIRQLGKFCMNVQIQSRMIITDSIVWSFNLSLNFLMKRLRFLLEVLLSVQMCRAPQAI